MPPLKYQIIRDEITGWSQVWVQKKSWFGLVKYWTGVASDGTENAYYPSSAFNEAEAEKYIKRHHERMAVRGGKVYTSKEYTPTEV